MKDIVNKLALGLFVSAGIMVMIMVVIFIQNLFSDGAKIKVSAFYIIIAVIFIATGIYFKKLKEKL
ncbi:hypothetical protein EGI22_02595 [Lacihabitans sp. LS3-19]|uniref:hypothetical protein n=1 Tax=Lacihabitans sp. LS3-19 TaxID=2487335 RepID=UPI0020CFE4A5|nr:hypothetical protein [Lacihabitans sp. LS3-19]MCP9766780.1 hypothetical protein [Lacihabitans sp. LS3-19]